MAGKGTVFAIFVYKYDDETRKFVVADDPGLPGVPYYRTVVDPDDVLREARDMIFAELVQEYKGPSTDQVIAAMNKAVDSVDATLIRLPRSADIDGDVGFLMGQLDAPMGDQDTFAYVIALVVKARGDYFIMKHLPGVLLPTVNYPEEI